MQLTTADLPAAVATSLRILRRQRGTETMEETLRRVVAIFEKVAARWALVGAHAIGIHTEPRATVDCDFVVEEAKLPAVMKALEEEFGDLGTVDMGPALRLPRLDVDLIRSTTHPLFGEALRLVEPIGDWRVPRPEVLIALKFLSAVSPWRGRTKQMYDVADLRALYLAVGKDRLDAELMERLAATVYPNAEAEFKALLARIESGEPLTI